MTRRILGEILVLWLSVLLLIRLCVFLVTGAGVHEVLLAAVPILFMYAPVFVCRLRGVDSWTYPLHVPAFSDREAWRDALREAGRVIAIVAIPWLIGYHLYQTLLFERGIAPNLPREWWWLPAYHVFFVAIPEEFFYRGYMQTRLDELWAPRWRIFGASLGPGWLLTCLLFAFGHSIVFFQWWHFAILFPSLVFGWLRARTHGVVAGALFHAWCNVVVALLDSLYGVVQP
ncbi:MAG: CPBP family intramembrane metalloprotease [Deltaproteobacteria bacterium]|nr:CPBP family intramembrane metalloprotease [Deltaproteobacteria bacterium]